MSEERNARGGKLKDKKMSNMKWGEHRDKVIEQYRLGKEEDGED